MTTKNKIILYFILFIFAIVAASATIRSVWNSVSEGEANAYALAIVVVIFISIWLSKILRWFKKRKITKKNFKSVSENAPNKIGVYVASLEGKVVYVGRAIEERSEQSTSGLRKRLKEHYRGASSGNDSLFTYKDEIHIEIHIVSSVDEATELEAKLIRKYNTVDDGWNKRYED